MPTVTDVIESGRADVVQRFQHLGIECLVVEIQGHYCGYVKTSLTGHYDDYQQTFDVHGGLTYGPDEGGWLGFDCAHAGDACFTADGEPLEGHGTKTELEMRERLGDREWQHDWRPQDVVEETRNLADQVAQYR